MTEASADQHQQTARQARPARRMPARRTIGLAVLVTTAVAVASVAALSGSASERAPQEGAASVRTDVRQDTVPTRNDAVDTERQPMATESVRDDGDGSTTQVTVNGESVTVPENGSYHRTTDDGDTRTDINVDSQHRESTSGSGGSSSSRSSSSVRINVQSNTTESTSE